MSDSDRKRKGPPPYPSDRKLVTVTLRILPAEIEEIRALAEAEGVEAGEWKRRAIRAALRRNEALHGVSAMLGHLRKHYASERVGALTCQVDTRGMIQLFERLLGQNK